ncbi:type III PLP-dependent enzyme [Herbidospora galbida]|uniref:Type III PLP-dependent enzyme n=1 Tax=Herbidospora galbida TaxID=2575442 RepID=A0A4U3MB10_9ACTN|nr:type III PLP-dependent enzyme [Herbidospora galbida]TKK85509.1 type III PLP-dependent enzyme [Herbidospora galbida]
MIADLAARLGDVPAYVYDLAALDAHAARVRAATSGIELYYAVKANPDPAILRTLEPHVDGFEVSSGGEFDHVSALFPGKRLAFGGPGKTASDLTRRPYRFHVESPRELDLLESGDVLLRVNLRTETAGAALAMSGPFGMDPAMVAECRRRPAKARIRGIHAHLASGLDAAALTGLAKTIADHARPGEEVCVGGGMAVDYADPANLFDWAAYGEGLRGLGVQTLRIEPGRAMTAYCGWYLTKVLDVKRVHGELFAILTGGTHHLRTPVTKGHDQPFTVFGSGGPEEEVTLVGQLCTPKDVFARRVRAALNPGDVVAFAMAGAYAYNISHHDFLMHPKPEFHYVSGMP